MKTIKAGRKIIEIKDGDYLLDNGHIWQFIAGDGRELYRKDFYVFSHVQISGAVRKTIDLSRLKKLPAYKGTCWKYVFVTMKRTKYPKNDKN